MRILLTKFFLLPTIIIVFIYITYNYRFIEISSANIDAYFQLIRKVQLNPKNNSSDLSLFLPRNDADMIFITFYYKNSLRGCFGSETTSNLFINNIAHDLKLTTLLTINDKRFRNTEPITDFSKLDTLITLIKKDKTITNVEKNFKKEYIPGLHSIQIRNGNKFAYYLSHVPFHSHWSQDQILEHICIKGGMIKTCYKDNKTIVILYNTTTYLKNKKNEIHKINKYLSYQENHLEKNDLVGLLKSSSNWFENNKELKGFKFSYRISLRPIYVPNDFNYIRQLASVRAYLKVCKKLNKNCLNDNKQYLSDLNDYYQASSSVIDDQIQLLENGKTNPALNALYILFLAETELDSKNELISKLANSMIDEINPDGTLKNMTYGNLVSTNIYTGEVYLALIEAYKQTNNQAFLKKFEAGKFNLIDLSNKKSNVYLHWISQALYEYYLIKPDKKIAQQIIKLNNYLIDSFQIIEDEDKYNIGAFSKKYPGFNTGFVIESIVDAYNVALLEHDYANADKFRKSIRSAIRFMSQLWLNETNTYYINNNSSILGSVIESVNSNYIRVDFLAHAVIAVKKATETDIYK